jgi:hypothetical protein
MMAIINALLCLVTAILVAIVLLQRREYRRLRADADGIVVRYVNVAERYESLVRDVTEPYGGVLNGLEDVNRLSACLPCLPDKERAAAQVAISCLDRWMRLLLRPVVDRYHLSAEDKQRWLNDTGEVG